MNRQHSPGPLPWTFPARTTHDGIPLGNGLFGALIWGEGNKVRITINRADYWHHEGGYSFGPEATWDNLRHWLEAGDEERVRRVFEGRAQEGDPEPIRPSRLPMGRVDLQLPAGVTISAGSLHLACGCARLALAGPASGSLEAVLPRDGAALALRVRCWRAEDVTTRSAPAKGGEVSVYWQAHGIPQPEIRDERTTGGWTQSLPYDDDLVLAWRIGYDDDGDLLLYLCAEYAPSPKGAWDAAQRTLDDLQQRGYDALADREQAWWHHYWRKAAHVQVPDATLQELYDLGMYKLAGISWPGTPAASLQGPWVEEYRMPPWSCDYHFNVNVQECYWPAYAGNQLEALQPLWEMLERWKPRLRENARQFLGIEDGLMLNHAVDDRCTCMGGFWTGTVDHGSTAWMAHMLWQYYLYTLDRGFLQQVAYPFIKGALRVYEEMLEEAPDGSYTLPVSVSPEYGSADMDAWGSNASFQLALIHRLARDCMQAARILQCDQEMLALWQRIDERTPLGSISETEAGSELWLWDGQPLAHSHRHHSHLAGLYPFDLFDPWDSAADYDLLRNSMQSWVEQGTGRWSGWCVPWAAILWARMHNGEQAALLLESFRRTFMTQGRATTHDAVQPGFSVLVMRPDIMQIEAAMGAATAVLEMLAHTSAGVLRIFSGVPKAWDQARFEGVRTEGGFLVSAERKGGRTAWARILSTGAWRLRLAPLYDHGTVWVTSNRQSEPMAWTQEECLVRDMTAGETLYVTRTLDQQSDSSFSGGRS